jgi:hypothetical protein
VFSPFSNIEPILGIAAFAVLNSGPLLVLEHDSTSITLFAFFALLHWFIRLPGERELMTCSLFAVTAAKFALTETRHF